jgi:hypothetical protein
VARLNEKLGAAFNPDTAFSKPLSGSVLRKLQELFAERGVRLDTRQVTTLSKVRRAVKAARLQGGGGAVPFAPHASRRGKDLLVGTSNFRIEQYRDRECIRVTADGATQRLYLPTVVALLAGLPGETAPTRPSDPLPQRGIGELVSSVSEPLEKGNPPSPETSSPGELEADTAPSLTERIRSLAASRPAKLWPTQPAPTRSLSSKSRRSMIYLPKSPGVGGPMLADYLAADLRRLAEFQQIQARLDTAGRPGDAVRFYVVPHQLRRTILRGVLRSVQERIPEWAKEGREAAAANLTFIETYREAAGGA